MTVQQADWVKRLDGRPYSWGYPSMWGRSELLCNVAFVKAAAADQARAALTRIDIRRRISALTEREDE